MEVLIVGGEWEAAQWRLALENADEHWRCACRTAADAALCRLDPGDVEVLVLCPGDVSRQVLAQLQRRPPLAAPWLIGSDWQHPLLDAACPLSDAGQLPKRLAALSHQLPRLAQEQLSRVEPLAAALLTALEMQPRLGAWAFLPQMLACCVVHPVLMTDLTRQLYPLCGAAHQLSAGCVERRLRLAVESIWNRTRLDTLENYFGQTIDPQRGKPTNKEFLAQLRICLAQQVMR